MTLLKRLSTQLLVSNNYTFRNFRIAINNNQYCSKVKRMSQRELPVWKTPSGEPSQLKVLNTMTKSKVPFIPQNGPKQVTWYNCGPTVYDASHMGHARLYVTIDTLRRVMTEYFGYDILFVMNITDIDDKIIIRARQNYLFKTFVEETTKSTDLNKVVEELELAVKSFLESKFETDDFQIAKSKAELPEANPKLNITEEAIKTLKSGNTEATALPNLLNGTKDVIAPYLDNLKGAEVTDQKVFRDLATYWEKEFMDDMAALNILPADVLTRVSEYVPEVVSFVEKIIDNGYGYEVDGSVYFDTVKFDSNKDHYYAKLEPNAASNLELIADGEGDLGAKLLGKRNPADFALWKKSKSGEPFWESPWGNGRPGWHIECSAMASEIFGPHMDIHSGGIDLAFPHHDNELAQSEAHHGCSQWVNYFLHVGHLHIEGMKMSKSLKNFITIKEGLEMYTARQLRLTFLMHQWSDGMDFKPSTVDSAIATEKLFTNFLTNAKALIAEAKATSVILVQHDFRKPERELITELLQRQRNVHDAFCDSFNTPNVIKELAELVSKSNIYLGSKKGSNVNSEVLTKVATYVTRILTVLGLSDRNPEIGLNVAGSSNASLESAVMPYLHTLAQFRDKVRALARSQADPKELLKACDQLRDNELVELGVLLDDREDGKALVKLVDKAELIKERDLKLQREAEKQAKKLAQSQALEQKRLERLEKGKLDPKLMFLNDKSFSKFDEQGIPTHDEQGIELTKSRKKKLMKDFDQQQKLHNEYLASV